MLALLMALSIGAPAPKYKPTEFLTGKYNVKWGAVEKPNFVYEFYPNGRYVAYAIHSEEQRHITHITWAGVWEWNKDTKTLKVMEQHYTQGEAINLHTLVADESSICWQVKLNKKLSGTMSQNSYTNVQICFEKQK